MRQDEIKVPETFPFKAEWIAALRSGKYKQAQGKLKRDGGYCCLGVYCEIAGMPIDEGGTYVVGDHDDYASINNAIGGDFSGCCISLNDTHECNFNDIADYIEGKQSFGFFIGRERETPD